MFMSFSPSFQLSEVVFSLPMVTITSLITMNRIGWDKRFNVKRVLFDVLQQFVADFSLVRTFFY